MRTTPLTQETARARLSQKALANYEPVPEAGCWIWLGKHDKVTGYAKSNDSSKALVHRLFYAFHVGDIPEGMIVCHKCDTPPCCNPDHLFLGTNGENMADKARKGRSHKRNYVTKLSANQAVEIFTSSESRRVLARRHGVDIKTIAHIKSRKTWKKATEACA